MTDYGAFATDPLFGLPLEELWFGLVFFILGMFLFLDGFDFGVGALFATRDDEDERETLLAAIGPFWDGNEVWLVVFGGALFAAFPAVYANLFSRHYLLMFAILGALILRGLAPEMYEQRHDEAWQTWWGRSFVVGSVSAPFFIGVFAAHWLLGISSLVSLPGVVVGLAVVALTIVAGVGFLGMKTRGALQRDVVEYGPKAMAAYLALVVVTLGYLVVLRPDLGVIAPIPLALVVITLVSAGGYLVTLREERYTLAFGTVPVLVFAFVALVAVLMFPMADPAVGLTVSDAIISILPLNIMSIAAALLLPLVFSYFGILYSTFRGPIETGESYS
ncbi:cytochrome d ubiquinol oxidase subunit II [Haloferax mediterranei ATCC 33500]|uniref:Cytochrome D Ubiquinol oxidase subunit II n=1 Tax=Haloferax mediterranei (strain ATCC 33500 / DSM 1411 / JCM 8866 / NBRC 14739 / NCIMB 2177 / R-4) TaxID=523841 RepID=I3R1Q3_HALMT|nr:cytochrome d ubiquinol oxidase subunit II [Haloferax mediterranei]AFK18163.1 cytochrome d ubiquinol oxidase subunit II [Haloferax mediterranei ATCC 33500]AHZ22429.1 cytochrome D ubiquinol oxidase subunit II [Haloferax mediterranei ATCC 33500]EMA02563.1 cytochrome d ubiquinol oxidase subunit II [Haloferax mediterranei ATCC 33500]MDX5988254.1 cytochrome d ubiquinol oxidase subunit II [Haloferax mediterranei ATCC 33500]QCQ74694.1 cytochrome d ubiquinol oxidase subunit II [Haloferax mediterrane